MRRNPQKQLGDALGRLLTSSGHKLLTTNSEKTEQQYGHDGNRFELRVHANESFDRRALSKNCSWGHLQRGFVWYPVGKTILFI